MGAKDIYVTFRVDREFYERYLKNIDKNKRSEFIRYAIETLPLRVREKQEYELLIDAVSELGRWRFKVWKPTDQSAKGRFVTFEILGEKYSVKHRYIRKKPLRALYRALRKLIEDTLEQYGEEFLPEGDEDTEETENNEEEEKNN